MLLAKPKLNADRPTRAAIDVAVQVDLAGLSAETTARSTAFRQFSALQQTHSAPSETRTALRKSNCSPSRCCPPALWGLWHEQFLLQPIEHLTLVAVCAVSCAWRAATAHFTGGCGACVMGHENRTDRRSHFSVLRRTAMQMVDGVGVTDRAEYMDTMRRQVKHIQPSPSHHYHPHNANRSS
jgi:hypothetical protein